MLKRPPFTMTLLVKQHGGNAFHHGENLGSECVRRTIDVLQRPEEDVGRAEAGLGFSKTSAGEEPSLSG